MKLNFLSKNLPAFGLDVSGGSFKIVEIGKTLQNSEIKSYSDVTFPKGVMVGDAISDTKTFDYLVKTALDKPDFGRLSTNRVIASLPESKSFVRVIQIPKMSDAEAENAVPYEAESFIPLPVDQVYLDWQKISDAGDNKMSILLIASPRDFVDKYLEILDKAGLNSVGLEVESQSCHRALIPLGNDETLLMVDLGTFRTSLIMVEDGNLQFTSTIPISGNTFTESIARSLGVSSAKAEDIKNKVGLSNTSEYPNIKTALLPVLNNLSEEIKNILKFHAEHSERPATRVLLFGGSGKLKNLTEFLAPQLLESGVSLVEPANPFINLAGVQNLPIKELDSLGFVTAIGLGLRGSSYKVD